MTKTASLYAATTLALLKSVKAYDLQEAQDIVTYAAPSMNKNATPTRFLTGS